VVFLLQNGLGNVRLAMNGTPILKKPFCLKPEHKTFIGPNTQQTAAPLADFKSTTGERIRLSDED